MQLRLAGREGVPVDASAVVLNVAAVSATGWGYLTAHPAGSARPNASNLNYDVGQTIANTVVARLGAGGDVCLYTFAATDMIVDVTGYLSSPPPPPAGPTCPPAPQEPIASVPVTPSPGPITFDGSHIWVATHNISFAPVHVLSKIDPTTNTVVDVIPLPYVPLAIADDDAYV